MHKIQNPETVDKSHGSSGDNQIYFFLAQNFHAVYPACRRQNFVREMIFQNFFQSAQIIFIVVNDKNFRNFLHVGFNDKFFLNPRNQFGGHKRLADIIPDVQLNRLFDVVLVSRGSQHHNIQIF